MDDQQRQQAFDYVFKKADGAEYMAMDTASSSSFQNELEADKTLRILAGEVLSRKYIKDTILNRYSKERRYITSNDVLSVISGISEDQLNGTKADLQNGIFEINYLGRIIKCTSVYIDQWETAVKRFGKLSIAEKRFVFLTCGGVTQSPEVLADVKSNLESYGFDVFVVRPNQNAVPISDVVGIVENVIAEKLTEQFFFAIAKSFSHSKLRFDESLLRRFLPTLLTKRFCILTGLAGSGKTKLAEAFAMWLCDSDQQYRIVAVGADWTGNENLLGYADALQAGKYCAPVNGSLALMLRAAADPAKPYFLILDEMNLSHVERYFADFLSAMESANSQLALHSEAADIALDSAAGAAGLKVPAKLSLPKNLFIIGTVNVDETTYMFSPKVLDRANVIEFRASAADMAAFLDDPADINLSVLQGQGVAFAPAFVQRAAAGADIASLVDAAGIALGPQLKMDLLEVFGALSAIGAEFGFRTAKEIARFMVIHQELCGTAWVYRDALDAQVLQKLMPKLHGSARKLSGVLKEVEAFATTKDLKLTLEKVQRMQQRLERDGFTSFAEA
ncbi:hypothetical protein MCEZEM1_00716 [Comamonadaceae bacterium]